MKNVLRIIFLFILSCLAYGSQDEQLNELVKHFDSKCVDYTGEKVKVVLTDDSRTDLASAERGVNGESIGPIILVNSKMIKMFNPETQFFILSHECAHHQLGHVGIEYSNSVEKQADCLATLVIKKVGLEQYNIEPIFNDISNVLKVPLDKKIGPFHPTLNERKQIAVGCMENGLSSLIK